VAFKLYDTFGLALDEQEEMAREAGIAIDHAGFTAAMQQQKERARASWKGAEKGQVAPAYQQLLADHGKTKFLGYEHLQATSRVIGLLVDHQAVASVAAGTAAELVLDQTPFYAETGGQVGDRGKLISVKSGEVAATVETVFPGVPGLSVHRIIASEPIAVGDELKAEVAKELRQSTERNHTATHLLHAALRQVLGTHVKQAGSVVEPPRLRFDFTHFAQVDAAELREIERLVNEEILRNVGVTTKVLPIEEALSTGAMALFGEKYGDQVRVVSIPGAEGIFSRELCGGTHVSRSGDIGMFKITSEGSISAGVRRIEAITGEEAVRNYQQTSDSLNRIAQLIRVSEPELVEQVERMLGQQKTLERQIDQLKTKVAQSAIGELETQARTVNGARVLTARVDGMDRAQMRTLADSLRNKWKTAVIVLAGADDGGGVSIVSAVTKDLTGKVQAGKLVGQVALAVGGKGGGRPDMAEGGGKDSGALPAALNAAYQSIEAGL
jgi:alanyl-tRNA synthetase